MSSNPTTESSPSTQPSPPSKPGSGRLIGLLVLLGVAIVALAFDYLSAGPTIEASDKKIESFVDETNRQGVEKSKRITPDEIHKLLGQQPTWTDKHPTDNYEVEYYCGWGAIPVINMRRHYLAVVYLGDEPRRYSSHYKNERPPVEALPIQQSTVEDTGEPLPEPTNSGGSKKSTEPAATEEKTTEGAGEGAPAEGVKKRKGKKKQEDNQETKPEAKQPD